MIVNRAEREVFDPKSLEVKKRFPNGVAKTPTGLAYDAKSNRLFIGCRTEPKMVVMDAGTGKVINSYPIGAGVDFRAFKKIDAFGDIQYRIANDSSHNGALLRLGVRFAL